MIERGTVPECKTTTDRHVPRLQQVTTDPSSQQNNAKLGSWRRIPHIVVGIGYAVHYKPESNGKSGKGGVVSLRSPVARGGRLSRVPKFGGGIGVVRVVSLRSLTELNGKSGMKRGDIRASHDVGTVV